MKTLYLLRHAKSSRTAVTVEDFDRPLTKRGRAAATAMGAYMAKHNLSPAQVLCSSAKRTRETLERLQEALGPVPARFEKGIYMAEAAALLRRVRRLNDTLASVMLIGHNPGLEQLALSLATGGDADLRRQIAAKFPTAGLAVIEADVDRWSDVKPGSSRLSAFVRPKDLDPALGAS